MLIIIEVKLKIEHLYNSDIEVKSDIEHLYNFDIEVKWEMSHIDAHASYSASIRFQCPKYVR